MEQFDENWLTIVYQENDVAAEIVEIFQLLFICYLFVISVLMFRLSNTYSHYYKQFHENTPYSTYPCNSHSVKAKNNYLYILQ